MRHHIRLGYDSTVCHAILCVYNSPYSHVEREHESLHGFISIRRGCLGGSPTKQAHRWNIRCSGPMTWLRTGLSMTSLKFVKSKGRREGAAVVGGGMGDLWFLC